jgi:hypothetical protein
VGALLALAQQTKAGAAALSVMAPAPANVEVAVYDKFGTIMMMFLVNIRIKQRCEHIQKPLKLVKKG